MPLSPIEVSILTSTALEILKPGLKEVLPGLWELAKFSSRCALVRKPRKTAEQIGSVTVPSAEQAIAIAKLKKSADDPEAEHQRELARSACAYVSIDDFIMPATELAARIFWESKFDRPGSPLWEMWAKLLACACDQKRVDDAHPAFIEIIKQLSSDEARILTALWSHAGHTWEQLQERQEPFGRSTSSDLQIVFPGKLRFYGVHLDSLGLTFGTIMQDYANVLWVNDQCFTHLTELGEAFVKATVHEGDDGI